MKFTADRRSSWPEALREYIIPGRAWAKIPIFTLHLMQAALEKCVKTKRSKPSLPAAPAATAHGATGVITVLAITSPIRGSDAVGVAFVSKNGAAGSVVRLAHISVPHLFQESPADVFPGFDASTHIVLTPAADGVSDVDAALKLKEWLGSPVFVLWYDAAGEAHVQAELLRAINSHVFAAKDDADRTAAFRDAPACFRDLFFTGSDFRLKPSSMLPASAFVMAIAAIARVVGIPLISPRDDAGYARLRSFFASAAEPPSLLPFDGA